MTLNDKAPAAPGPNWLSTKASCTPQPSSSSWSRTASRMLRQTRSSLCERIALIFSRLAFAFTHRNISLKTSRSAPRLADSATTNSRSTVQPFLVARSRQARSWASIE